MFEQRRAISRHDRRGIGYALSRPERQVLIMPSLVFPSLVRDQILGQHIELRDLLAQVIADVTPAHPARRDADPLQLATTARELCARFKAHLAFENEELARVFAALDSWGPERVRALHEEHLRQRQELDALLMKMEGGCEAEELALELRELATRLARDMEEEEAGCLSHGSMSANSLVCERHSSD
jgi:Hemerythrin HHE cation binding domain